MQLLGGVVDAFLAEVILSSFLVIEIGKGSLTLSVCFVALSVATHSSASDNAHYGVAIELSWRVRSENRASNPAVDRIMQV